MTVPSGSSLLYPPNSQPSLKRVMQNRAPTATDYKNFREGDEWLDKSSDDWWKLADITGTVALWVKIGGTAGAVETFIPDTGTSPVVPDVNNEVTLAGSTGIITTGGTNTITWSLDGSVVTTQYDGDSGSATPSSGVLNIIGGNGTVTSASGNTVVCEMQSPFVGDFSFESNTGGTTETFTVQNTVDQASSAAIADIQIAGTSSDFAQWRVGVGGTGSFSGAINSAGTKYSLNYLDDDDVTPSTASNEIYRVDSIDTGTGYSRLVKGGEIVVADEGTGTALIGINSNANATDTVLQFVQLSGTHDARLSFNMNGPNWGMGVDASASNDFFLTQATISAWPPSASTTIIHVEKEQTGSTNFEQTGALTLPRGTTGERPSSPVNGMIRYNTTTAKLEGYEGGAWANLI